MEIYILFGQRKQRYEGECGPEIIAATDEFSSDDSPDWLAERKLEAEQDGDFESLAIITFEVSQEAIMKRLRPDTVPLKAKIVDEVPA